MSMPVRVSNDLYDAAKEAAKIECRSAAKQLEYWARAGKAAFENPDLPISFIAGILDAREQKSEPFTFEE